VDTVSLQEEACLSALGKGELGTVVSVIDDGQSLGDEQASTIARRLLELGFVPGAELEVVARMWPGDDPLAVRIGGSTFALRRREAQAIRVRRGVPAPATDASEHRRSEW
jgi:ferrous iron transport protein A